MDSDKNSILIVDDNVVNRVMLNHLIKSLELNPAMAESGQEALEMMAAERYDLVLLDIMMPGIDGTQVLEHIKSDENLRDIPVIMISALTSKEKIIECLKSGAVDYITKPIEPKLVRTRIWRHLQNTIGYRKDTAIRNDRDEKPEILIVDDDRASLKVLSTHLSTLGYQPILAENGIQALEILDKQHVDLILLDILMPELDGVEVLGRIKANIKTRDIPVVMVSAVDDYNTITKCLQVGAEDYIIKPFNMVLLSSRVASCIAGKQSAISA